MEEKRQEWLSWRKKGLGGSDAPIIMGVSKWKKPYALYMEKRSTEKPKENGNWATNRGNELEPIARAKFCAEYNFEFDRNEEFLPSLHESEELPFARVSLDGINRAGDEICEIKFQGKDAHDKAKQQMVPSHYAPQLQWGMMVTGALKCWFISINEDKEIAYFSVPRDENYMVDMIKTAGRFWSCVERGVWDFYGNSDDLFEQRASVVRAIKQLEDEKKELELQILEKYGDKDVALDTGYGMQWVERTGAVNWKKMVEDLAPQVMEKSDHYRGKSSKYMKFMEPKNETQN